MSEDTPNPPAYRKPLHVFKVRAIHEQVKRLGYETAVSQLRGRGVPQLEIDIALAMPEPPPREL